MGDKEKTIEWTPEKLARFKAAHRKASDARCNEFTFDGHEFATGYAMYLIEYLEGVFGK